MQYSHCRFLRALFLYDSMVWFMWAQRRIVLKVRYQEGLFLLLMLRSKGTVPITLYCAKGLLLFLLLHPARRL